MRALKATLTVSGVMLLCGCSVHGQWMLDEVEPTEARADVRYDSITLMPDGRFYAEHVRTGERTAEGRYTYRDGILRLEDETGDVHHYDAKLQNSGKELELVRYWNGQRITVEYEKAS